jgi:HAMP domain-containing protein
VGEKLIENTPGVLAAILVFIGTMLTVFASIQNSKRQGTIEHLREEVEEGAKEKEALASEVARLRAIPWWQFWRK